MVYGGNMRTLKVNSPSCHCVCWWRCSGWPGSWRWQQWGDKYARWGEFWVSGLHLKDGWNLQEVPRTVGNCSQPRWLKDMEAESVFSPEMKINQMGLAAGGVLRRTGECEMVEEIPSGQGWGQVSESIELSGQRGLPWVSNGTPLVTEGVMQFSLHLESSNCVQNS